MSPLYLYNGQLLIENGALASSIDCCCSGCCCINGYLDPTTRTRAVCEQCEDVYDCYEYQSQTCRYAERTCTYPEPDENGQCPEGSQPTFWGGCEQCSPCPEGYTLDPFFGPYCVQCDPCPEGFEPDGFGGCSRVTAVSDCETCPGYCSYVSTNGLCGSFSADCKGGCLYNCCFCEGQCQQRTYIDCLQCGGYPSAVAVDPYCSGCSADTDCCNIAPCDEECEWPEQISVTISGMPEGYVYRFQSGGNGMPLPPGTSSDLVFRASGPVSGPACTSTSNLPKNGTYVLDRVSANCNLVEYVGVAEGFAGVLCSGQDEPTFDPVADVIVVRLGRFTCGGTGIGFSAAFGSGAHAVVTQYDHTTGAITAVQLCKSGSGYATQVDGVVRVAQVDVSVYSFHGGGGAVLQATVDSDPDSATFGQITALTIINGGTGYGIGGWSVVADYTTGYGSMRLLPGEDLTQFGGVLCAGQDLSNAEEPASVRVSKEKCGVDLLRKSFSAMFTTDNVFPGAVSAADGIDYSLGRTLGTDACIALKVIGITWEISG